MTDLLGSRYRLLEVLGQGAMGVVWRAHDTVLDRHIAIKELRPSPGVRADEALERFIVEARAAARLAHPNIVGIHDVFRESERVLIAMELIEGPTLDRVIAGSGALPPATVRAVMAQVAQALAAAHAAGVIHRDLKPDNIFWTTDGRAVVTDFGLARIGAGRGTVEGTVMGTPGYMAPEQVRGTLAGAQADIFGWGAVAYELLTGRPPFGAAHDTDPVALAYRIVHEDPAPVDVPDDPVLGALVMTTLAKDPSRRPRDGQALIASLSVPEAAASDEPPVRQSSKALALAGAACVALLVVVGIALFGRGTDGGRASATGVTTPAPSTTVGASSTTTSTSTSTTTTTAPPSPLPTSAGSLPAGSYVATTMEPRLAFRLGEGWSVESALSANFVELVRDGALFSFIRVDAVYDRARRLTTDAQLRVPGARVDTPVDLFQYLSGHPMLSVSDRRSHTMNGRTVESFEIAVTSGVRGEFCTIACVVLLPLENAEFLLISNNRNRMYVLRTGERTQVAVIEAPPDVYDSFATRVESVLDTLTFP